MSSNSKPRLPSRPPGPGSLPADDPYSPSSSLAAPSSPQVSPEVRRQSTLGREDLLRHRLALRSDEFTESLPLVIRICTWNVNAKRPDEDISPWLLTDRQAAAYSQYDVETLDIDASQLEEPDIYAIGFQEIVDLSASNLLIENEGATRPWEDKIERLLKQRYVQKHKSSLVGLALLVYVKRGLAEYVSDIAVDKVGVGIMGVGGNKGRGGSAHERVRQPHLLRQQPPGGAPAQCGRQEQRLRQHSTKGQVQRQAQQHAAQDPQPRVSSNTLHLIAPPRTACTNCS